MEKKKKKDQLRSGPTTTIDFSKTDTQLEEKNRE